MIIAFKKVSDGTERFVYYDSGTEISDDFHTFEVLDTIRQDHVDHFIYGLRHNVLTHSIPKNRGMTDVEFIREQVDSFNNGMRSRTITDPEIVDFLRKKLAYADEFVEHENFENSSRSGYSTNSKEMIVSPEGWKRFYLVREFKVGCIRLFALEDLSAYRKKHFSVTS